jgi:hypothetical protein
MTIKETVRLMLKSCDFNPYTGKLTKKENYIAAIELAKLCKKFADDGDTDEAMDLSSEHWQNVIDELLKKQSKL